MTPVTVVGAGWSGLACALTLQQNGVSVRLIDAAPQPGGRARRLDITLGDRSYALDNGQHLLLGACRATLGLMRQVGIDLEQSLQRMPFTLAGADGFRLQAGQLPAPWHLALALLRAHGLGLADRLSILRDLMRWRRLGWRAATDEHGCAVFRYATATVMRRLWRPLCLAALNVSPGEASAQVLLNVLRDSLDARAADADMLLPRVDLSALFPQAATTALQAAGTELLLRSPVLSLQPVTAGGWTLMLREQALHADTVVLALPPDRAAMLLTTTGSAALYPAIAQLQAIKLLPIATVSLRYPEPLRLPCPAMVLADDPSRQRFGQWVFDRGSLHPDYAGVLTVVISGDGPHLRLSRDELARCVVDHLTQELGLPTPVAAFATTEKHATIAPCPGLSRPPGMLPAAGLYLASDAADSPYPSTLEGSVRSGIAAAQTILTGRVPAPVPGDPPR